MLECVCFFVALLVCFCFVLCVCWSGLGVLLVFSFLVCFVVCVCCLFVFSFLFLMKITVLHAILFVLVNAGSIFVYHVCFWFLFFGFVLSVIGFKMLLGYFCLLSCFALNDKIRFSDSLHPHFLLLFGLSFLKFACLDSWLPIKNISPRIGNSENPENEKCRNHGHFDKSR